MPLMTRQIMISFSPLPYRARLWCWARRSRQVRGLPQALIIYLLALLLGVKMNWNPLALIGVILFVGLGAACFSTFSLIIASLLKNRDRVMGIGQLLTMPLFFASNAIYPISIMPSWLQVIANVNPLTYVVNGLRTLMLAGGNVSFSNVDIDFVILLAITTVLILLGSWLYPGIVQ
jgi:ABC-2 type transport system permease protein